MRLTLRAVCEEKEDNDEYYGVIDEESPLRDNRFGEVFHVIAYSPSSDETGLLVQTPAVPRVQGIFMQSDVVSAVDGKLTTLLMGKETMEQRNNVQQLADRLNIVSHGLTLSAAKGRACGLRLFQPHQAYAGAGRLVAHLRLEGRPDSSLALLHQLRDRPRLDVGRASESEFRHPPDEAVHSQSAAGGIQRGGWRHRARRHRVVRSAARSAAQLHEDRVHRCRRAEEAGTRATLRSRTFPIPSR